MFFVIIFILLDNGLARQCFARKYFARQLFLTYKNNLQYYIQASHGTKERNFQWVFDLRLLLKIYQTSLTIISELIQPY